MYARCNVSLSGRVRRTFLNGEGEKESGEAGLFYRCRW